MPPHIDHDDLKRFTWLRPDKYVYWFKIIHGYPQPTYVCSNSLIDLGDAWRLEDAAFYHVDRSKSTAHYLIIPKTMVEQLSNPPEV